jgi:hypothetical protein
MSSEEIDRYLESIDEPKRSTLHQLRSTILEVIPEAEECFAYSMPAFKIRGKVIAGFAAFKHHLSYCRTAGRCSRSYARSSRRTRRRPGHCNSPSTLRCRECSWRS